MDRAQEAEGAGLGSSTSWPSAEPLLGLAEQRPHLWGTRGASRVTSATSGHRAGRKTGLTDGTPPRTCTQRAAAFVKYGSASDPRPARGRAPRGARGGSSSSVCYATSHATDPPVGTPCRTVCVCAGPTPPRLSEERIFRKTFWKNVLRNVYIRLSTECFQNSTRAQITLRLLR